MFDRTLSTIALCVSFIALAFTGWQSWLAYEHNGVSVSPKLVAATHLRAVRDDFFRVEIVNVGLGPAIIRDASITFDGQSLGELGTEACNKLSDSLNIKPDDHTFMTCWAQADGENMYLRAGDSVTVYQFGQRRDGATVEFSADPMTSVNVTAEYCSFYDVCVMLN